MGASESAPRREEDQGGGSGAFIAKAAVAAATVGVAAWGISKMLADNSDSEEEDEKKMKMKASASRLLNSRNYREVGYSVGRKHGSYPNDQIIMTRSSLVGCGYKMNTDGKCPGQGGRGYNYDDSTKRGPSAYAGILRNDSGEWVRGFQEFIGVSDGLTAEFHGIHKGLLLLDRLGYVESILESDCKPAVEWINDLDKTRPSTSQIIKDCWEMIKECRQLKAKNRINVILCSEDANKCADKLADLAFKNRVDYSEIMDLPHEIKEMVAREATMFFN